MKVEDLIVGKLRRSMGKDVPLSSEAMSSQNTPRYMRLGQTTPAPFEAPQLLSQAAPAPMRPADPEEMPEPILGADGQPVEAPPELVAEPVQAMPAQGMPVQEQPIDPFSEYVRNSGLN